MPVTGSDASGSNTSPWLTSITEDRDASTNITHQTGGAAINNTPGGVGELLKRSRTIGSQTIDSTYSYADAPIGSPMVGIDPQPQTGMLRKVETSISSGNPPQAGPALVGSEVFRTNSTRIGASNDLAFTGRQSRWTYDPRGRVQTTKLLVPVANIGNATSITDHHNEATFRDQRDTAGLLSSGDIATLNDQKLALTIEPPKWTAQDSPAHEIDSKTLYLDGQPLLTGNNNFTYKFEFEGGRRKSDGIWKSDFDEFGRLLSIENDDRRIEYTYDPRGRIIGRTAKQKSGSGTQTTWVIETRASVLPGDGLPAETTFVWDSIVDRLVAIYEAGKSTPPSGSTQAPPPEAGLVRQYLHGDRDYDDPVEVLIASQAGATPVKYFPIFDEAGTDSLQAVLDKDGNVVERVLYGDSFGDAPHYLQGPTVERVTYAADAGGAVDIRVHASEKVKQLTIDNGVRLVALDASGAVVATAPTPTLDPGETTIHWHLGAGAWQTFTASATQIRVAVTPSLRTYSWGDVPFSTAPEFAKKLYSVQSEGGDPLVIDETLTHLATLIGEQPLYEIKSLYMAGLPYSKSKLLTGFHALPYSEPASGLIFARARWYDPATGMFITPDPMGYHDASSLYAFAAGDPVNQRDPAGLQVRQDSKDLPRDFKVPNVPINTTPQTVGQAKAEAFITNFVIGAGVALCAYLEPCGLGLLIGTGVNMGINGRAEQIDYENADIKDHGGEAFVVGASNTFGAKDWMEGHYKVELETGEKIDDFTAGRMEWGVYGSYVGGAAGGVTGRMMFVRPAPQPRWRFNLLNNKLVPREEGSTPLVPGGGLAFHERLGTGKGKGHTIAKHIGQTVSQLKARLKAEPKIPAASTFGDRVVAERAIFDTLLKNQVKIEAWLRSGGGMLPVSEKLKYATGFSLERGSSKVEVVNGVRIILLKDSTSPTGYRILTAYPEK
ncbi:MAG TPA: RNase A-like domain-containing protein [Vicinamibacterales bacterium]|nr:RNase A-like domain-containing protein [Vicinamibacterales bacterium]